jgi:uncharacterized coiled-coil DUF342 family protein
MERHIAIKKLTKLLGKNLGYRVDLKAPYKDERDEARAKLKEVGVEREALREKVRARCNALLAADEEYQRLKADMTVASKTWDELASKSRHYRFTAGVMNSAFFVVKAQGDSWEEVIDKIQKAGQ